MFVLSEGYLLGGVYNGYIMIVYFFRTTSRLILNEISLISAISPFVRVQVVQFDGLSYREQVRMPAKASVSVCM